MRKHFNLWMLLVLVALGMASCTENEETLAPGVDGRIVGNWYSDVSGMTDARWNYGETLQNSVFNDDGTGRERI